LRELLAGREAIYCEGERKRAVRLLHPEMKFVNVKDPVPIYIGANLPKAIRVVGEVGDGWITVGADPAMIRNGLAQIRGAAKAAGRALAHVPTVIVTAGCALRDGEGIMSPRVFGRLGSRGALTLHTIWHPENTPIVRLRRRSFNLWRSVISRNTSWQ
jgi:alkanesulfonate monooxygenase SsuD/methylene tetrahydromethanopterin reductase-like flavin-dependent oxidoreductase (luciferase family)